MTKICTSLEQSKKLVELGIDINTADMCWKLDRNCLGVEAYNLLPLIRYGINEKSELLKDKNLIPAWSLSALLELMPIVNENTYTMRGTLDGGAFISHEELTCVVSQEDNPLDAAFEMVCWLLENKKL